MIIHDATWINFEHIMLIEIIQKQKENIVIIPLV